MKEEMVIDGYNVVVLLDDGYLYLWSVNKIEVRHLSDAFVSYIESSAIAMLQQENEQSRAERKINQLQDKQFFNL